MAVRTFLALPLDEEILDRLSEAQGRLSAAGAHVRWVGRENLHLTMKFLGDVQDKDLAEVCRLAKEIASGTEPFEFVVKGFSCVPPSGQMRMVWGGIEEPTGRLAGLQEAAERTYATLGFRMENRWFSPHLTVARVKSGRNVPQLRAGVAELAEAEFGLQQAQRLIVFSSDLTPEGPVYSPLTDAPLGGG